MSSRLKEDSMPPGAKASGIDQQVHQELIKRSKFLESVLDNAPDAIVTLDARHRILEWNPGAQAIFGYHREEAVGRSLDELVAGPDVMAEASSNTSKVLAGGVLSPMETIRYRKDGSPVHVIAAGSPIVVGGSVEGVVAVYTDITRIKAALKEKELLEARLKESQKMEAIGTLAGGIAHDFNNLLMGIQGRCSLMLAECDPSDPAYEQLQGIEECVRSASDLTRQLLGLARGGKYEVQPTDLNSFIEAKAAMFGRTRKEVRIHGNYRQPLWSVEIDRGQIEQVLLNLFINAWQAMPGGGDLFIETDNVVLDAAHTLPFGLAEGRYVKFSLTDNGIGMEPAIQQRIFDPFFSTKEKGRGTGLGLASAYGIIQHHHGIIRVASEVGRGSTFTIYLPASDKTPGQEMTAGRGLQKGCETVLLVDDEPFVVDVGCKLLEYLGYSVISANDGRTAVKIYEQNKSKIALVIVDMIMPEMSGAETFDRLKSIDASVKVLLASGYSIEDQAGHILEKGCSGFIQKPYNLSQLSHKVRQILDAPPACGPPRAVCNPNGK